MAFENRFWYIGSFLILVAACYLVATQTDRDEEVDPYNALSVQNGILKILQRQLKLQEKQLAVQEQQIQLQSKLLTVSNQHQSVLPDLIWWSCILAIGYFVCIGFRRYGLSMIICLFVHYCSRERRHRTVGSHSSTGMPRSEISVLTPEHSVSTELPTFTAASPSVLTPEFSVSTVKAFGLKYGSEATTL